MKADIAQSTHEREQKLKPLTPSIKELVANIKNKHLQIKEEPTEANESFTTSTKKYGRKSVRESTPKTPSLTDQPQPLAFLDTDFI